MRFHAIVFLLLLLCFCEFATYFYRNLVRIAKEEEVSVCLAFMIAYFQIPHALEEPRILHAHCETMRILSDISIPIVKTTTVIKRFVAITLLKNIICANLSAGFA